MSQVKYTKEQMKSMSQEDLVNDVINPLAQELEEKQAMLRLCQEEIALLKQRLFGRKTEKYVVSPNEQLSIEFNEAEAVTDTTPDEEPAIEETITYTRKKSWQTQGRPKRFACGSRGIYSQRGRT